MRKAGGKTIEKIRDETEQAVKNIVAGAIPMDPANPNPKQITVSSYVPPEGNTAREIRTSSLETVTSLLSQWGSAVGLALFALWALWMLKGTMPKAAPRLPRRPRPKRPLLPLPGLRRRPSPKKRSHQSRRNRCPL